MKSLLSVSFCFLLLCCSCASSITKGCRKSGEQRLNKELLSPMVDASDRLCKYNMTVDFMRKHFSGMLLVKQTGTGTYRTLFSTHFGLSLFDLEISSDSLLVHYCVEPLKKKKILNLLRRDFSVLLGLNLKQENDVIVYSCTQPQSDLIYRLTAPGFNDYYRMNKTTGRTQEIRLGSGLRKITFRALPDSAGKENIRIHHTGLKLLIGLEILK